MAIDKDLFKSSIEAEERKKRNKSLQKTVDKWEEEREVKLKKRAKEAKDIEESLAKEKIANLALLHKTQAEERLRGSEYTKRHTKELERISNLSNKIHRGDVAAAEELKKLAIELGDLKQAHFDDEAEQAENRKKWTEEESQKALQDHAISVESTLERRQLEIELHELNAAHEERWKAFNALQQKATDLINDPVGFLKKMAREKLIQAFSKKARLETKLDAIDAEEQKVKSRKEEDEKLKGWKNDIEDINRAVAGITGTLTVDQRIQLEQDIDQGNEDNFASGGIIEALEDGNVIADNALKQDAQQHKDDSEKSAFESLGSGALGSGDSTVPQSREMTIAGPPKPEEKGFGMPDPKRGLKGIIGNIMGKFGKAGKFLMNFGAKFLMPLITTPIGWAVLAGLAVGGLVFAYWDDIVAFVGKMFTGIKSMFSKVVSKISGMFSAVGNAIKEVISFFNPLNLLPMIARALLPTDMYDAVSSFFGGDTTEERDTRGKRDEAGVRAKQAESDAIEADDDLGEAMEVQKSASADLNRLNRATAVGIHPNGNISIVEDMVNFQHNVPGAVRSILKSGARVATPEEVAALKASKEKNLAAADMKVKDLTIKSHAADRESYFASAEHKGLDDLVKGSDQKKKKPGNVVADLVRSGAVDYSMFGNSTIKDWGSLRKLDYDTLEKVLAFDDWNDRTKRGILGIMDEKKQLMGANDLAPVAPNEISIKKKDDMVQQAVATGMRNKVGSSATTALPTSNNTVVAPTNVNNTTIKPPPASDTDVTNLAMQKGSAYASSF